MVPYLHVTMYHIPHTIVPSLIWLSVVFSPYSARFIIVVLILYVIFIINKVIIVGIIWGNCIPWCCKYILLARIAYTRWGTYGACDFVCVQIIFINYHAVELFDSCNWQLSPLWGSFKLSKWKNKKEFKAFGHMFQVCNNDMNCLINCMYSQVQICIHQTVLFWFSNWDFCLHVRQIINGMLLMILLMIRLLLIELYCCIYHIGNAISELKLPNASIWEDCPAVFTLQFLLYYMAHGFFKLLPLLMIILIILWWEC